jgi:hypothetical protein
MPVKDTHSPQRNDGRDDERHAQIAEEEPQHDEHQGDAHEQRVRDGVHRQIEQLLAIVERDDLDPGRQSAACVDVIHPRAHAREHHACVLAAAHEDDALDRLRVLVELHLSQALGVAELHGRDIADPDRGFEAGGAADAARADKARYGDVADVIQGAAPAPRRARRAAARRLA